MYQRNVFVHAVEGQSMVQMKNINIFYVYFWGETFLLLYSLVTVFDTERQMAVTAFFIISFNIR